MNSDAFEVMPGSVVKDSLGRVIIKREDRTSLVGKFLASSLTQAEFCRRERLNATTFSGWLTAYRSAGSHPTDTGRGPTNTTDTGRVARRVTPVAAEPAFRELRVESTTPVAALLPVALTVMLPGGVEVRGCDATTVVALIKALRGVG